MLLLAWRSRGVTVVDGASSISGLAWFRRAPSGRVSFRDASSDAISSGCIADLVLWFIPFPSAGPAYYLIGGPHFGIPVPFERTTGRETYVVECST